MTLTLTDPPRVVELKKEFRKLDETEEALKLTHCGEIETPEMVQVRARKAEIAREIFESRTAGDENPATTKPMTNDNCNSNSEQNEAGGK